MIKRIIYLLYNIFVSKIPGGTNSLGKSIRRKFQQMLGVKLGRESVIGYNTMISYHITEKIRLGDNSGVGPYSHIMGTGEVIIGDNVICAPKVTFVTRWHDIKYDENGVKQNIQKEGGIFIDNDVFIGTNVTILPNVTIGERSIIASGTTVYKSVPPHSFVRGSKMIISD